MRIHDKPKCKMFKECGKYAENRFELCKFHRSKKCKKADCTIIISQMINFSYCSKHRVEGTKYKKSYMCEVTGR